MEKKRGKRSKPMDDGVWDCSVCTFKNSAEAFKCAMCDVRKGTSTRKPKPNPQLVAQQVAQQMVTVPKKHTTKRAAERVDLGSDTSQDSHRSETRDGELTFLKASSSVQTAVHPPTQQSSSVLAPSTSRCETSKPPDDQPKVNTSRPGHETTNHAAFARHHPQPGEPHNKSFSSVRQNVHHPASSNGFAYPSYMDITVNGLTVRIEERDPKNANSRQAPGQKMKRRKTGSNLGLSTVSANPSPAANNSHRMSLASDASSLDNSNISEPIAERTLDRTGTETSGATQTPTDQPAVSSGEVGLTTTPTSTCSMTPVASTQQATPPQPSTPPTLQLQPQKTTEALHGEPPN